MKSSLLKKIRIRNILSFILFFFSLQIQAAPADISNVGLTISNSNMANTVFNIQEQLLTNQSLIKYTVAYNGSNINFYSNSNNRPTVLKINVPYGLKIVNIYTPADFTLIRNKKSGLDAENNPTYSEELIFTAAATATDISGISFSFDVKIDASYLGAFIKIDASDNLGYKNTIGNKQSMSLQVNIPQVLFVCTGGTTDGSNPKRDYDTYCKYLNDYLKNTYATNYGTSTLFKGFNYYSFPYNLADAKSPISYLSANNRAPTVSPNGTGINRRYFDFVIAMSVYQSINAVKMDQLKGVATNNDYQRTLFTLFDNNRGPERIAEFLADDVLDIEANIDTSLDTNITSTCQPNNNGAAPLNGCNAPRVTSSTSTATNIFMGELKKTGALNPKSLFTKSFEGYNNLSKLNSTNTGATASTISTNKLATYSNIGFEQFLAIRNVPIGYILYFSPIQRTGLAANCVTSSVDDPIKPGCISLTSGTADAGIIIVPRSISDKKTCFIGSSDASVVRVLGTKSNVNADNGYLKGFFDAALNVNGSCGYSATFNFSMKITKINGLPYVPSYVIIPDDIIEYEIQYTNTSSDFPFSPGVISALIPDGTEFLLGSMQSSNAEFEVNIPSIDTKKITWGNIDSLLDAKENVVLNYSVKVTTTTPELLVDLTDPTHTSSPYEIISISEDAQGNRSNTVSAYMDPREILDHLDLAYGPAAVTDRVEVVISACASSKDCSIKYLSSDDILFELDSSEGSWYSLPSGGTQITSSFIPFGETSTTLYFLANSLDTKNISIIPNNTDSEFIGCNNQTPISNTCPIIFPKKVAFFCTGSYTNSFVAMKSEYGPNGGTSTSLMQPLPNGDPTINGKTAINEGMCQTIQLYLQEFQSSLNYELITYDTKVKLDFTKALNDGKSSTTPITHRSDLYLNDENGNPYDAVFIYSYYNAIQQNDLNMINNAILSPPDNYPRSYIMFRFAFPGATNVGNSQVGGVPQTFGLNQQALDMASLINNLPIISPKPLVTLSTDGTQQKSHTNYAYLPKNIYSVYTNSITESYNDGWLNVINDVPLKFTMYFNYNGSVYGSTQPPLDVISPYSDTVAPQMDAIPATKASVALIPRVLSKNNNCLIIAPSGNAWGADPDNTGTNNITNKHIIWSVNNKPFLADIIKSGINDMGACNINPQLSLKIDAVNETDPSVVDSDGNIAARPGDTILYTITYKNMDIVEFQKLGFWAEIPEDLDYMSNSANSVSSAQGSIFNVDETTALTDNKIRWGWSSLKTDGDNVVATFKLKVPNTFGATGKNSFMASVFDTTGGEATKSITFLGLDHLEYSFSSNGLTCNPEVVTIKACQDNAVPCTLVPFDVSISTPQTVGGDPIWSDTSTIIIPANDVATLSFRQNTPANVILAAPIEISPSAPINPLLCNDGVTEADCTISFADTGLKFFSDNLGSDGITTTNLWGSDLQRDHVIANKPSTIYLAAVKTNNETGKCDALFVNKPAGIDLKISYNSANSSIAPSPSLDIKDLVNNTKAITTTESAIYLNFDENGIATIPMTYTEAGDLTLTAKFNSKSYPDDVIGYAPSTTARIVSIPVGFCVELESKLTETAPNGVESLFTLKDRDAGNTCASSASPNCAIFSKVSGTKLGSLYSKDGFTLGITPMKWSKAADELDNAPLCNNLPVYNFENVPLSISTIDKNVGSANITLPRLITENGFYDLTPSIVPILGGNAASGRTDKQISIDNVGVYSFAINENRLSTYSGVLLTSNQSNPVRFVPDNFYLSTISKISPTYEGTCGSNSSYMGEPFDAQITILAQGADYRLLSNYNNDLAKAKITYVAKDPSSSIDLGNRFVYRSTNTGYTIDLSDFNNGEDEGTYSIDTTSLTYKMEFLKNSPIDGPFDSLIVGISVDDNESSYGSSTQTTILNNIVYTDDLNLGINKFTQEISNSRYSFRNGRMTLQNVFGQAGPLYMPVEIEYWDSLKNTWLLNTLDSCTIIPIPSAPGVSQVDDSSGVKYEPALKASEIMTRGEVGTKMVAGEALISWDVTNSYMGKVTAPLDLSTIPWLQWEWNWGTGSNLDPRACATFGVGNKHDNIISWKEGIYTKR